MYSYSHTPTHTHTHIYLYTYACKCRHLKPFKLNLTDVILVYSHTRTLTHTHTPFSLLLNLSCDRECRRIDCLRTTFTHMQAYTYTRMYTYTHEHTHAHTHTPFEFVLAIADVIDLTVWEPLGYPTNQLVIDATHVTRSGDYGRDVGVAEMDALFYLSYV